MINHALLVLPLEQSHMADPVFQAHGKGQNRGLRGTWGLSALPLRSCFSATWFHMEIIVEG